MLGFTWYILGSLLGVLLYDDRHEQTFNFLSSWKSSLLQLGTFGSKEMASFFRTIGLPSNHGEKLLWMKLTFSFTGSTTLSDLQFIYG
jgi:hypothetical protein